MSLTELTAATPHENGKCRTEEHFNAMLRDHTYAWRPGGGTNPSTPLSIKEIFQHFYLYNQIRRIE
jgi:hypothetical protein